VPGKSRPLMDLLNLLAWKSYPLRSGPCGRSLQRIASPACSEKNFPAMLSFGCRLRC
jgi:hypothetical protein